MMIGARSEECDSFEQLVPAYVEYVLTGRGLLARAAVEEHVAGCRWCAAVYADLLGMWVAEQVELVLDLSLSTALGEGSANSAATRENTGVDLDLILDVALHWSEVSGSGPAAEERNAASALVCVGTLLEQRGELARALRCFDDALVMAETAGNGYARARCLGGRGRAMAREGRKAEAVASLREACQQDSAMRDEFGLVRDTIALGDVFSGSKGIRGRLEALRCYVRASRTASSVGYPAGGEAAEARLSSYKDALAAYFRSLIGDFVQNRLRRESMLLDDFCRAFVSQMGEVVATGGAMVAQPALFRLGFGGVATDLKTPALLATVLVASTTLDFGDIATNIGAAGGSLSTAGSFKGSEARRATARTLREVARAQGLSKKEAEEFSEYMIELIVKRPELGRTGFEVGEDRAGVQG